MATPLRVHKVLVLFAVFLPALLTAVPRQRSSSPVHDKISLPEEKNDDVGGKKKKLMGVGCRLAYPFKVPAGCHPSHVAAIQRHSRQVMVVRKHMFIPTDNKCNLVFLSFLLLLCNNLGGVYSVYVQCPFTVHLPLHRMTYAYPLGFARSLARPLHATSLPHQITRIASRPHRQPSYQLKAALNYLGCH